MLLPPALSSLIAPDVRMFELQLQASGHIPCVVRLLMTAYTNRRFRTTHWTSSDTKSCSVTQAQLTCRSRVRPPFARWSATESYMAKKVRDMQNI